MACVSAAFYRFAEQQQQNGVGRTNQALLRAQEAAEKMKNSVRSLSKNHQVVLLNESVRAIFFSWQYCPFASVCQWSEGFVGKLKWKGKFLKQC